MTRHSAIRSCLTLTPLEFYFVILRHKQYVSPLSSSNIGPVRISCMKIL